MIGIGRIDERYYLNPHIDEGLSVISASEQEAKKGLKFLDRLMESLEPDVQKRIEKIVMEGVEKNNPLLIAEGVNILMDEYAAVLYQ